MKALDEAERQLESLRALVKSEHDRLGPLCAKGLVWGYLVPMCPRTDPLPKWYTRRHSNPWRPKR